MNRRNFIKRAVALVTVSSLPVFAAPRPRIDLTSESYQIIDGKYFAKELGVAYAPNPVIHTDRTSYIKVLYPMRGTISREFIYCDELAKMLRNNIRYQRQRLEYLHSVSFMRILGPDSSRGYWVLALRGRFARNGH
jgi:hypothetical protein